LTKDYVNSLKRTYNTEIKRPLSDSKSYFESNVKNKVETLPITLEEKKNLTNLIKNNVDIGGLENRYDRYIETDGLNALEAAVQNRPGDVERLRDKTIMEIESIILEKRIYKGILEVQLALYELKEGDSFENNNKNNILVKNFIDSIQYTIVELETVEEKLIKLKCELGRPNSTGGTNQGTNPNPSPKLPDDIDIAINSATVNLDDKSIYKRDGFVIKVQWELDGNGEYKIINPLITQDIVVEGLMSGNPTRPYKIKANLTFDIQKGMDGKYTVTYIVNSWDKI
jgi:hypothetical protein